MPAIQTACRSITCQNLLDLPFVEKIPARQLIAIAAASAPGWLEEFFFGDQHMTPERLEVREGGRLLRIVWHEGSAAEIGAVPLRAECRSAGALRARIDNAAPPPGDVRITAIQPIGNYAVNIAFSDGQDRGIYPWALIAELAERYAGDDPAQPPQSIAPKSGRRVA
jgi:DUF971 family protein